MRKAFLILSFSILLLPLIASAIKLNLDYPSFGGININEESNQELGKVIAWFYYLIVGISGLAAFAMLVFGGIQWLSSAGNPGRISDAKSRIQNALLGLLLILGSFLILQIINPELTILKTPGLDDLKPIPEGITVGGGTSSTYTYIAPCEQNIAPSYIDRSRNPYQSPVSGYVTSPFGWDYENYNNGLRKSPCHYGIDIGSNAGRVIRATADGTVTYAGSKGTYGTHVDIDHGSYFTSYSHMDKLSVGLGSILKGQEVGTVGNSGAADGKHLHYEISNAVQEKFGTVIVKKRGLQQNVNDTVWGICGSIECSNGNPVIPVPAK